DKFLTIRSISRAMASHLDRRVAIRIGGSPAGVEGRGEAVPLPSLAIDSEEHAEAGREISSSGSGDW
ncbi:MAG TPA: hypothetical protein VH681_07405, partial [Nitrospiraceae bacterium]